MRSQSFLAALLAAFFLAAGAAAHEQQYLLELSKAGEGNESKGTGSGKVTFDLDELTMKVEVNFTGLTGTTTVAHIHCCTAEGGVGNAGVATEVPSFVGFPTGVTAGSYNHLFDMKQATSFNPQFVTNNGGTLTSAFNALVAGADAQKAYLNIHSSAVATGEIRGYLRPVPEPSTFVLLAIGGIGLVALRRAKQ